MMTQDKTIACLTRKGNEELLQEFLMTMDVKHLSSTFHKLLLNPLVSPLNPNRYTE